jgi:hypothetical protein
MHVSDTKQASSFSSSNNVSVRADQAQRSRDASSTKASTTDAAGSNKTAPSVWPPRPLVAPSHGLCSVFALSAFLRPKDACPFSGITD